MSQLVEERGRLVDAVIEQANSSTPQLAAELAKSLEVRAGGRELAGCCRGMLPGCGIACMPVLLLTCFVSLATLLTPPWTVAGP